MESNPQQYFMVVDEQSTGPYTLEELKLHPKLTPDSLVWKPGLDNWVPAKSLSEFSSVFIREPETPGYQTPPEYSRPNPGYQDPGAQRPQNPFANNPQYNPGHSYHQNTNHGNHHYEGYDRNYQNGYRPNMRTNWLPWAIVATVFGFFTSCIGAIFGIIGIVQANKANTLYAQGFDREGDSANSNARIMTIIGLIFAGLGILFLIFFGNFFSAIGNLSYY